MPDPFQLVSDSSTPDSGMGFTDSGDTVQAAGFCRLRTAGVPGVGSTTEQDIADQRGWQVSYTVDLPVGVTVDPSWRVVIGGRTFEIGGVVETGAWALVQTLVVKEFSHAT